MVNKTNRYPNFGFVSPCGPELNFIRCDDLPVVYTNLVSKMFAFRSKFNCKKFKRVQLNLYYTNYVNKFGPYKRAFPDTQLNISEINSGKQQGNYSRILMIMQYM